MDSAHILHHHEIHGRKSELQNLPFVSARVENTSNSAVAGTTPLYAARRIHHPVGVITNYTYTRATFASTVTMTFTTLALSGARAVVAARASASVRRESAMRRPASLGKPAFTARRQSDAALLKRSRTSFLMVVNAAGGEVSSSASHSCPPHTSTRLRRENERIYSHITLGKEKGLGHGSTFLHFCSRRRKTLSLSS